MSSHVFTLYISRYRYFPVIFLRLLSADNVALPWCCIFQCYSNSILLLAAHYEHDKEIIESIDQSESLFLY